ncbi:hypothetical protein BS78_02G316100 [Paspalum vaginatum]|nr:hypothetical protein BS78_02G316100 [Paspalum vaginatum]
MEAQAQDAHRWAGESGGGSNYIAKYVGIQNQVLKAAAEANGLLEEAGALELDMKTAVLAFDSLTYIRSSTQSQVQAQDYERDIVPRYKEALNIGLASCKDHFQKKGRSTTSVSRYQCCGKIGCLGRLLLVAHLPHFLHRCPACHSPLPHIIGSEEYNHDDSCGLAEFQGESLDSGPDDVFGSEMPGVQQGFEKTDIIVSASREFKEMLKAAFVTPYKFYDGDAITTTRDASLENTSSSEVHQNTVNIPSLHATVLTGTGGAAALQNPDINVHDIYSALVGLFDAGDEIMSVDPAPGSANPVVAESAERASPVNETAISEDEQLID